MAGFLGKDYREFMRALNMESTAKLQQKVPSPQGSQGQVPVSLMTPTGQENKLPLVLILRIYVLIPDSLTQSSKSL